jgi:integrase
MRDRRSISVEVLRRLWSKYTAFRTGYLAPSTVKRDYRKIERRLKRLADSDTPGNAISIRDWLLANYSHEVARRTIQQLNAACKWAQESDMLAKNPFEGVGRQLRPARPKDTSWASFTPQERDRIIAAIDEQAKYYGPWVRALFWTGARPEELAALQWRHVANDNREILITEALPIGQTEPQATKNYKSTRFPCNDRLIRLLREQRERSDHGRRSWVLPGEKGGRLHYTNFQRRYWRPIVKDLAEKGQIAFYLSQYHARHTWITGALDAGLSVQDVAYLARVSTTVIYKHYASRTRSITVPEF